ncbi:MAG: hypothetical protein SGPRY_007836 [Prymnesium sp.]
MRRAALALPLAAGAGLYCCEEGRRGALIGTGGLLSRLFLRGLNKLELHEQHHLLAAIRRSPHAHASTLPLLMADKPCAPPSSPSPSPQQLRPFRRPDHASLAARRPEGVALLTVSNHKSTCDDPQLLAALVPASSLLMPRRGANDSAWLAALTPHSPRLAAGMPRLEGFSRLTSFQMAARIA